MIQAATLLSRSPRGNRLLLHVHAPTLCEPGQFFMLRAGRGLAHFLRQPLFPCHIQGQTLAFLIDPGRNGALDWLGQQPEGTALDLLGPLGHGFVLHPQLRRLVLVAESAWAAPLLALIARSLDREGNIGFLLQAPTAADLLSPSLLPPAVEYHAAAADGSSSLPTTLDDILPQALAWADAVCVAGSASFLAHLKGQIGEARFGVQRGFAQALAPVPLACGIGACLGCLVTSAGRGHHRACMRGPVFDLAELQL